MASNEFHDSVMASFKNRNKTNSCEDTRSSESNHNSDKTPSWLQEEEEEEEENQATVMGSELEEEDQSKPWQSTPTTARKSSSSLFGAVMQKIGSSIGNPFPRNDASPPRHRQRPSKPPGTPQSTTFTDNNVKGTMSSLLTASPSGKTIRNIVSRFNSPFRFQSPMAKKRNFGTPDKEDDEDFLSTPSRKRRRRRLESSFALDQDAYSNDDSSSLQQFSNEGWSNMSEAGHWREAPITKQTMEILDWSLPAKLKLELHAPAPLDCYNMLLEMDALAYWEFRAMPHSSAAGMPVEEWSNMAAANKSIDLVKMGRRASMGSLAAAPSRGAFFEGSKQASMPLPPIHNNNTNMMSKTGTNLTTKECTDKKLATHLIQSVRGPLAKYCRKRVMEGYDRNELPTEQRQWQDALQSLFQNYRNRLAELQASARQSDNPKNTAIVLQNYFYCVAKDHIVLFRVLQSGGALVPAVLVTRTSESFHERLRSHGVDAMDILETADEQPTRENSMAASNRKLFATKDEKPNNPLLSPSVNADLEALRRAQAFGESAGADVYVKIKKSRQNVPQPRQQLHKPMRVEGWDNVSTFFEVYLNCFGRDVTPSSLLGDSHESLPVLLCSNGLGPFDHASLRQARMIPVPPETTAENTCDPKSQDQIMSTITFEVCGRILPCTMRKVLVASCNFLLQDEAIRSTACTEASPSNASLKHDSSRYIVLHSQSIHPQSSTKSNLQTMDVTKESMALNQGAVGQSDDSVFECPVGKSLSMSVWDISRADVAACKLEGAMSSL